MNREILPTKASARVLNTWAEKGSSAEQARLTSESSFGLTPALAAASFGAGKKRTMLSIRRETPSWGAAAVQKTGVREPVRMPARMPAVSSSRLNSSPSKNFSISSSELSAAVSTRMER